MTAALSAWIILNNLWSIACEGKKFSEFQVGDGLIQTPIRKGFTTKAGGNLSENSRRTDFKEPRGHNPWM